MEVILVKPIKKLGVIGDIVKVKDGFGRNYLIPKSFAIKATEKNKQLIKDQEKELHEKNTKAKIEAKLLADQINAKDLTFIRQASSDGRLFGSIAKRDLANEVSKVLSSKISYISIMMEHAIKIIGISEIELSLHPEVSAKIIVNVARSETEGLEALLNYKNSSNINNTEENPVAN